MKKQKKERTLHARQSEGDERRYKIVRTQAKEKKYGAKYYAGFFLRLFYRIILIAVTLLFIALFGVYKTLDTVAHGPSDTFRDFLVQSAMQASATKWVPGLFLSDGEVQSIVDASGEKVIEEVDVDPTQTHSDVPGPVVIPGNDDPDAPPPDISDGIEFHLDSAGTFRAYVMIVHDPSKVFVGVSSSRFKDAVRGMRIYDAAEKYNAIAAINGGEFQDTGGVGLGERPIGLTYSRGECVWDDGRKRTFIGIDKNDKLVVAESMTREQADALNIRDGLSFQTKNVLIETIDGKTVCYYAPNNKGKAQRTAIGQRADGKFVFIVTDGRSASSIGADYDDVIDMMVKYGAVTAAMLDGGSSSMMYYKNYISKYNVNESELDEYQRLGLVTKYKAFTRPRYLPTFFMVGQ